MSHTNPEILDQAKADITQFAMNRLRTAWHELDRSERRAALEAVGEVVDEVAAELRMNKFDFL